MTSPADPDRSAHEDQPATPSPALASWSLRAQSALVDWFAPGAIAWVLFRNSDVYVWISLVVFAWVLYNRYLEGQTGQSTGRRLAGTRLVRASDGRPIGPALAIVRHFVHVVDAIILFLGFLLPLVDPRKQTIADKIMRTVVVKAYAPARAAG